MAARNKPAGIRSLVYGMGKGKAGIEGLRVLGESYCSSMIGRAPREIGLALAIHGYYSPNNAK
jgi:hypothetical protein